MIGRVNCVAKTALDFDIVNRGSHRKDGQEIALFEQFEAEGADEAQGMPSGMPTSFRGFDKRFRASSLMKTQD